MPKNAPRAGKLLFTAWAMRWKPIPGLFPGLSGLCRGYSILHK